MRCNRIVVLVILAVLDVSVLVLGAVLLLRLF
jgi:hypothetical protein